jgi:hypothetical protein
MKEDKNRAIAFFKLKDINARPISKKKARKTPDLDLFIEDTLFGCSEIKSIVDYDFIGERSDPTYNKIQNKIHAAAKQFAAYNPNHSVSNILFFVNHYQHAGFQDLWTVLSGQVTPPNKPSKPLFVRYAKRLAEKNDLEYIDYFIWLDVLKGLACYTINDMTSFQKVLKERVCSKAYEYLSTESR